MNLTPAANKLYRVQVAERCYVSGIEAPDARVAMELAEKEFPARKGKSISVEAQNIYEASIDLSDDASDIENGIFGISIRGCDPERVQRLKMAIVKYIGGPYLEDDDVGNARQLENALQDVYVVGY